MSVNTTSTTMNEAGLGESGTPMFAAVPAWERNRKRRGFGGKVKPAARAASVQPATETVITRPSQVSSAAITAPLDPTGDSYPLDTGFAATPAYATRSANVKRGPGRASLAIAAGIVAIGGLAAAGWYATQPRETAVAQLSPSQEAATLPASTSDLSTGAAPERVPGGAATTVKPAAPAMANASVPASKPAERVEVAKAARTRPAVARSAGADEAAVDTSATLPAAPQPYSGPATAPSAPADIKIAPPDPVSAAPVQATPAPTATAPAPEPVATPPN